MTNSLMEPTLKQISDLLRVISPDLSSRMSDISQQNVTIRRATITLLASNKASIRLDGSETDIPDVPWLESSFPRGVVVNDLVWVVRFGTTALILGPQHTQDGAYAPLARVKRSTDQGIPNNVDTPIDFSSAILNPAGLWQLATSDRIISARAGYYDVSFTGQWATGGTGRRIFSAYVTRFTGGATEIIDRQELPPSTGIQHHKGAQPVFLNVGDYVQLKAFQTSGASLNAVSNTIGETLAPTLAVVWQGPPVA